MRLIDADVLLEALAGDFHDVGDMPYYMQAVVYTVMDAPTIDAEPVVRCKDCVYWWKGNGEDPVCLASIKPDAYCSEGERI